MTIQDLNAQLTLMLKLAIRKANHIDTGHMISTVEFECVYTDRLRIRLSTPEYIVYLQQGRFLKNFLDSSQVNFLISDYITSKTYDDFLNQF